MGSPRTRRVLQELKSINDNSVSVTNGQSIYMYISLSLSLSLSCN